MKVNQTERRGNRYARQREQHGQRPRGVRTQGASKAPMGCDGLGWGRETRVSLGRVWTGLRDLNLS